MTSGLNSRAGTLKRNGTPAIQMARRPGLVALDLGEVMPASRVDRH